MKFFFISAVLFSICMMPVYSFSDIDKKIQKQLHPEQLKEFKKVEKYRQPKMLPDGQVIVPLYRESAGEIIVTAEPLSKESRPYKTHYNHSAELSIKHLFTPENPLGLNDLVARGEVQTLLEVSSFASNATIQSVNPKTVVDGVQEGLAREENSRDEINKPPPLPADVETSLAAWANDPCGPARENFLPTVETPLYSLFKNVKEYDNLSNSVLRPEARKKIISLSEEYDKHCLKPLDKAVSDGSFPEKILPYIVIITLNEVPICGGVRVSKRKVLTARHCFFNHLDGSPKAFAEDVVYKIDNEQIGIYVLDEPSVRHKVSLGNPPEEISKHFGVENDFVYFDIEQNRQNALSSINPIEEKKAKMYSQLYLVGYFALHNPHYLFREQGAQKVSWQKGLRVTNKDYCRIFDIGTNNVCIVHACQSILFFSGGGLLSTGGGSDGGVGLYGINTNAGESVSRSCGSYKYQKQEGVPLIGTQGGVAVSYQSILD